MPDLSKTNSHASGHRVSLTHIENATLARYEQVDEDMFREFELVTIPNAPPIQVHEDEMVNKTILFDSSSSSSSQSNPTLLSTSQTATNPPSRRTSALPRQHSAFRRIKGTIREPVSYFQKMESTGGAAWGKASTPIDASAARVFAEVWLLNSYSAKREYTDYYRSSTFRRAIEVPNSHSMIYVKLVPFGLGVSGESDVHRVS